MIEVIISASNGADECSESMEPSPDPAFSPLLDGFSMQYSPFPWGLNHYQPGEFSDTLADAFMDHGIHFDFSCSGGNPSRNEHLAGPISAILEELGSFYSSLEADNQLPSGDYFFDMATAYDVLTPENLQTHMAAYFRYTNHYHPIIHSPTFDVEHAQPVLVLALFVCGSMYYGDRGRDYRGLYNLAEGYAFAQLKASMERDVDGTVVVLDALRAATLIHSLQWIISCASSRRRNRELRLPALVSAVRSLGYTRLRHETDGSGAEEDWEKFIQWETCIRCASLLTPQAFSP